MTCLLPSTTCAFVHHIKRCNTSSFDNVINVTEIICFWLLGLCVDGFPIQGIPSEGKVGHIGSNPWHINSEKLQATDGKTIDVVICIHEQSPLQPSLLLHRDWQVDQFGAALRMGHLEKFPGNKLSQ